VENGGAGCLHQGQASRLGLGQQAKRNRRKGGVDLGSRCEESWSWEALLGRITWPLQVRFSTKSKDRNTVSQQRQLLNLGHMTTRHRCRLHLILISNISLTLFYPLYSSLHSSQYPLPRQQHTYHGCRPCRQSRQSRQTAPI
jgi:hypothetical protein